MLELLREYLTVEQIAERWAVDPIDVQQLILIRQLKQSFVVFGPATIYLPVDDGSLRFHPLTERGSVPSCILVDAVSDSEDFHLWPLAQISKAFDFLVHGVNRHELQREPRRPRVVLTGRLVCATRSAAALTLSSFQACDPAVTRLIKRKSPLAGALPRPG